MRFSKQFIVLSTTEKYSQLYTFHLVNQIGVAPMTQFVDEREHFEVGHSSQMPAFLLHSID